MFNTNFVNTEFDGSSYASTDSAVRAAIDALPVNIEAFYFVTINRGSRLKLIAQKYSDAYASGILIGYGLNNVTYYRKNNGIWSVSALVSDSDLAWISPGNKINVGAYVTFAAISGDAISGFVPFGFSTKNTDYTISKLTGSMSNVGDISTMTQDIGKFTNGVRVTLTSTGKFVNRNAYVSSVYFDITTK